VGGRSHKESEVTHLHLDVKDTSLLLNLLLDSRHGQVEDRQALGALQGGRCHHVARGSDQVDLPEVDRVSLVHIYSITCSHLPPYFSLSGIEQECSRSPHSAPAYKYVSDAVLIP